MVMSSLKAIHKRIVTVFATGLLIWAGFGATARAQEVDLDMLFDHLKSAPMVEARGIAEQIQDQWLRSGSPAMDLLLRRGMDALEAGEVEAAIEHLTALVDHAPEFAAAYNARAMAYFEAEKIGPALADIQTALRLNPRHFAALRGLAAIYEITDRPQKAIEVYRKVLEINPASASAADAIARLLPLVKGVTL